MTTSHQDEMNEMKLLNRKNKGIKHLVAKAKIDQTGDIQNGKDLLQKLDNQEVKVGSGSLSMPIVERKVGGARGKKKELSIETTTPTNTPRPKTAWQLLVTNTMKEKGLNLKETLKYIKEHNLYKK
jgi:hypothetical protein